MCELVALVASHVHIAGVDKVPAVLDKYTYLGVHLGAD